MKVTQKDIAKRVGSSTSLVSRVLSGQAHKIGVNPKKVEEIFRVAKEMNYVPSPAALVLKGKKTRTIGLVVCDFYDPYFAMLIGDIQELAHIHNYSTLLVGFLNRKPKDSDLMPLYKHSVDGIIILGTGGDLSWTDSFSDIPIARIGHGDHKNLALSVGVDETDAMRKIFSHLKCDLNLSNAAYASRSMDAHEMRRKAVVESSQSCGISVELLTPSEKDSDFYAGIEIASSMLSRGTENLPQAVVCATDTIAMGIIKRFHEAGVRVPENVAIVGFDDIPAAANYIPAITSFRQPTKRFAHECFNAIIEKSDRRSASIEGELIVRKSSMR